MKIRKYMRDMVIVRWLMDKTSSDILNILKVYVWDILGHHNKARYCSLGYVLSGIVGHSQAAKSQWIDWPQEANKDKRVTVIERWLIGEMCSIILDVLKFLYDNLEHHKQERYCSLASFYVTCIWHSMPLPQQSDNWLTDHGRSWSIMVNHTRS